jgi:hypothetical protein
MRYPQKTGNALCNDYSEIVGGAPLTVFKRALLVGNSLLSIPTLKESSRRMYKRTNDKVLRLLVVYYATRKNRKKQSD